jgi:hypothetical protein
LLSRISCARCARKKVVVIILAAHFSNNAPTNLLVAAKYSRFLHRSSDPRRLLLRNNNRSLQFSEILIYKIASPGRETWQHIQHLLHCNKEVCRRIQMMKGQRSGGRRQKWQKTNEHKAEVDAQKKKLQKTDEEQNKIEDRQRICRRQMEGQTWAFVSYRRNGFASFCLFAKTTTGFWLRYAPSIMKAKLVLERANNHTEIFSICQSQKQSSWQNLRSNVSTIEQILFKYSHGKISEELFFVVVVEFFLISLDWINKCSSIFLPRFLPLKWWAIVAKGDVTDMSLYGTTRCSSKLPTLEGQIPFATLWSRSFTVSSCAAANSNTHAKPAFPLSVFPAKICAILPLRQWLWQSWEHKNKP